MGGSDVGGGVHREQRGVVALERGEIIRVLPQTTLELERERRDH